MKMKNLQTGEEREFTEEEFQRMLSQSEIISVQQVRTDAYGVEHVTDLFGGGDDDEIPFWQGGTAPSEEAGKKRRAKKARQTQADAEFEAWKKAQKEEQAAYRRWCDEWNAWAKEVSAAERNRNRAYDTKKRERKQELIEEARDQWNQVKAMMEEERKSLEAEKAKAEAEKADAATALSALGFFQFSEKNQFKDTIRQQDRIISATSSRLREIMNDLETAKQGYKMEQEEAEATVLREQDAIRKQVEALIPLPGKPSSSQNTKFIELAIQDELQAHFSSMTMTELMDQVLAIKDASTDSVKRILDRLVLQGKVNREVDFRGYYVYSLGPRAFLEQRLSEIK